MSGTLVLGLGNPLMGDDGVGSQVIKALTELPLPSNVQLLEGGTPGIGLIPLIQGRERLIIVDAADMGLAPGTVNRFRWDEAKLAHPSEQWSLHDLGLKEALDLALKLGRAPADIVILGVQPGCLDWGQGLSLEVKEALPALVAAVLKEIGEQHAQNPNH